MDPADVHDIVAKLHRGRPVPLGSCQCASCQTCRASEQPLLLALKQALRAVASRGDDFTLDRAYVPLVLAALEELR